MLAWGEPFDSPLWEGRRDGFAYFCRELRVPGAGQDTLEAAVRSRLSGRSARCRHGSTSLRDG